MIVRRLHVEAQDSVFTPCIKVAFATCDRRHINQHFGQAQSFMIYGVDKTTYQLIDVIDFSAGHSGGEKLSRDRALFGHQTLTDRIATLTDCDAVYFNECGSSALKQLLVLKTYPIKVKEGEGIKWCLDSLVFELNSPSGGWIDKALTRTDDKPNEDRTAYLDSLLNEPWDSKE
ncbi:NifB/NifX family molybdenum-iron cluster-binding protein [Vibrio sp. FNV 38]|nr:NifB/NifX family molybdenum-iron cluster-binding protein [Vibrio sp. FNV 38]